jgi:hypothetical protein
VVRWDPEQWQDSAIRFRGHDPLQIASR